MKYHVKSALAALPLVLSAGTALAADYTILPPAPPRRGSGSVPRAAARSRGEGPL